ncbi:RNA polymerase sigma factor [Sulfitobacter sp. 20_GPM-1509m]|uniref:RNA polymerase sigma factor n=1 Tax=Sulfitobacter sp. 20_GPM-1509m TaxID=1380367 RepID=UPI0018CC261E|nr:sigma-70 family RNA polymerase sigma factor [Sulfitobacter sp. 20_GPM-1509m]
MIAEIPHLRRYARALVRDVDAADDLVQLCLERAINKLHLWQTDRKLRTWLFTIMRNIYIDMVRHRATNGPQVSIDLVAEPSVAAQQEEVVFAKSVLAAIDQLPTEHRDVLILVGVNELSYSDAASILSIPVGTLMSRLTRARERLRVTLNMEKPRALLRQVK